MKEGQYRILRTGFKRELMYKTQTVDYRLGIKTRSGV